MIALKWLWLGSWFYSRPLSEILTSPERGFFHLNLSNHKTGNLLQFPKSHFLAIKIGMRVALIVCTLLNQCDLHFTCYVIEKHNPLLVKQVGLRFFGVKIYPYLQTPYAAYAKLIEFGSSPQAWGTLSA